jgi:hypothetical protein
MYFGLQDAGAGWWSRWSAGIHPVGPSGRAWDALPPRMAQWVGYSPPTFRSECAVPGPVWWSLHDRPPHIRQHRGLVPGD